MLLRPLFPLIFIYFINYVQTYRFTKLQMPIYSQSNICFFVESIIPFALSATCLNHRSDAIKKSNVTKPNIKRLFRLQSVGKRFSWATNSNRKFYNRNLLRCTLKQQKWTELLEVKLWYRSFRFWIRKRGWKEKFSTNGESSQGPWGLTKNIGVFPLRNWVNSWKCILIL